MLAAPSKSLGSASALQSMMHRARFCSRASWFIIGADFQARGSLETSLMGARNCEKPHIRCWRGVSKGLKANGDEGEAGLEIDVKRRSDHR